MTKKQQSDSEWASHLIGVEFVFGGIFVYLSDFRLFCGFSGVLKSAKLDSVWCLKKGCFRFFMVSCRISWFILGELDMRTFSFMSHWLGLFSRISRMCIILLSKKETIMTQQTFLTPLQFRGGAQYQHAESRLSGNSLARIARVIVILLVSFFGANNVAHAFGAVAVGTYAELAVQDIAGVSSNEPTPQQAREAAITNCIKNVAGFGTYHNNCSVRVGYFGKHAHVYKHQLLGNVFLGIANNASNAKSASIDSCVSITGSRSFCPPPPEGLYPQTQDYLLIAEDTITTCPTGQNLNEGDQADTTDDTCECSGDNEVSTDGNSCMACTGGEIPNTGKTACESCMGGMVPNGDNSACVCLDGQESDGSNSCTACTGNEVSMGGADCQSCTGEMVPNSEKTSCEACPSGMIPNTGKTACETCPSGMVPNSDNSACECPDGQTANAEGTCVTNSLNCSGDKIPNAANVTKVHVTKNAME